MLVSKPSRFFYVIRCENFSGKVRLQNVLQPGELGMIEESSARANVGINEPRIGGILPPMRQLVAVGVENWIEAQGLNGFFSASASG